MLINPIKIIGICLTMALSFSPAHATGNMQHSALVGSLADSPLWDRYIGRFLQADGRIIDNANGNVSHSEGQGYGMLLSVAANDQKSFDKIYAFAKQNLGVRQDRLFAWRYNPNEKNSVDDINNASDGDLLIAWALLEAASASWGEGYRADAYAILADLSSQLDDYTSFGLVIRPGENGFTSKEDDNAVVNPSYWIFPAIERIAEITGDAKWLRLISSGEQLIDQLMATSKYGVPDWAVLSKQHGSLKLDEKRSTDFGYDAVRVPLYLLMASSADKALTERLMKSVTNEKRTSLRHVNLKTNKAKDGFKSVGYRAIVDLDNCMREDKPLPRETVTELDQLYYPATLQLLSISTAKRGNPKCL